MAIGPTQYYFYSPGGKSPLWVQAEPGRQTLLRILSQEIASGCNNLLVTAVASARVQGWGDEPCEPTVRLSD